MYIFQISFNVIVSIVYVVSGVIIMIFYSERSEFIILKNNLHTYKAEEP